MAAPRPHPDFFPNVEKLNEAIEGTVVDVAAFRAVFERIERNYGEAARALGRAVERLRELTEVRDALLASALDTLASLESEPQEDRPTG